MDNHLVLMGSPFEGGRCDVLAGDCVSAARQAGKQVLRMNIYDLTVEGCRGCNICKSGACPIDDDMDLVRGALDGAAGLDVVCPVFFSGPPAQFKALLDRLQPYFWHTIAAQNGKVEREEKRPAVLHVVGQGGDPHGYSPLVTICKSALACAGFQLVDVIAHIGENEE